VKLHPRNQAFAWQAPRPPHRRITPEQARAWNEQGGFLLEAAFTPAEIAEVLAEIDPIDAEVSAFLETRPGGKLFIAEKGNITFAPNLVLRSKRLARFCSHRVFADLCHDLIGPDVRLYWEQAVYKKPEKPGTFPWHQDNGYRYIEPQQYLTCWVALTSASRENGCPWIAPGQHLAGTLEHWMTPAGWQCLREDPADLRAIEAPAGSIVVFSSLTPHRTGPNLSRAVRKSYIVQFAPDGARAFDGEALVPQDDPARQYFVLRDGQPVPYA
jgi:ectoine hydroxylase-related dioxygenase (phytanoyl-CoA dioxygenase family)